MGWETICFDGTECIRTHTEYKIGIDAMYATQQIFLGLAVKEAMIIA